MYQDSKTHLLHEFFRVNDTHDAYRKESFDQTFPELEILRNYVT